MAQAGLQGRVRDPMDVYKATSDIAGRHAAAKQAAKQERRGGERAGDSLPAAPPLTAEQGGSPVVNAPASMSSPSPPPASSASPSPLRGGTFMGIMGGGADSPATAAAGSPQQAAEMLQMQQSPTAEKMVRGIVAVGDMTAATIAKTAQALAGALTNYATNAVNSSAPLEQPLTVSKSYVARLSFLQMFTGPAAQGAQVVAQYAGELAFWVLQAALMVYNQLAAMKVVPQITTGAAADAAGVPINPVSGGLPLARAELATFKLVAAALLMAYVQVYDALEEAAQLLFTRAAAAGERYLAHRHGGEAADVASAALSVASDLLTLTLNWFRLLGRGLVSKAATTTAKTYLKQHVPNLHLD